MTPRREGRHAEEEPGLTNGRRGRHVPFRARLAPAAAVMDAETAAAAARATGAAGSGGSVCFVQMWLTAG